MAEAMAGAIWNLKIAAMVSRQAPTPRTSAIRIWRRRKRWMIQIPANAPTTLITPLAICAVIEAEADIPAYSRTLGA